MHKVTLKSMTQGVVKILQNELGDNDTRGGIYRKNSVFKFHRSRYFKVQGGG